MNLYNIATLQVKIIPNPSKKNMPEVSPKEIWLPIISFIIILSINKPNRMNMNDFEGIKYISLFLISNLESFTKKNENKIPTVSASKTSESVNWNIGNKNINPPVLINRGGKIIFFTDAGFSDDFILINIIVAAIIAATIVLKIKKNGLFRFNWSIL